MVHFCKRLFIVKCFADVLNNIFQKLKKKLKDKLAYPISKKLYKGEFILNVKC
jgi:hypothetical protein